MLNQTKLAPMFKPNRRLQETLLNPLFNLLLWGALATVLPGCGSNNATKDAPSPGTFSDVYQNYLGTPECTSCHVPGDTAATQAGVNLDFSSQANAYASLVTNSATDTVMGGSEPAACKGIPLVTAGNPSASYLVAIAISSYNQTSNFNGQGCTPDNTHLTSNWGASDAMASSITTWIQNGAQNN